MPEKVFGVANIVKVLNGFGTSKNLISRAFSDTILGKKQKMQPKLSSTGKFCFLHLSNLFSAIG